MNCSKLTAGAPIRVDAGKCSISCSQAGASGQGIAEGHERGIELGTRALQISILDLVRQRKVPCPEQIIEVLSITLLQQTCGLEQGRLSKRVFKH